jgi:branched-chain amino acid aminotransferase
MGLPTFDGDFALEALKQLVQLDADWVPHSEGTSLYIRPFMIATTSISASTVRRMSFYIILSPSGSYYPPVWPPSRS